MPAAVLLCPDNSLPQAKQTPSFSYSDTMGKVWNQTWQWKVMMPFYFLTLLCRAARPHCQIQVQSKSTCKKLHHCHLTYLYIYTCKVCNSVVAGSSYKARQKSSCLQAPRSQPSAQFHHPWPSQYLYFLEGLIRNPLCLQAFFFFLIKKVIFFLWCECYSLPNANIFS